MVVEAFLFPFLTLIAHLHQAQKKRWRQHHSLDTAAIVRARSVLGSAWILPIGEFGEYPAAASMDDHLRRAYRAGHCPGTPDRLTLLLEKTLRTYTAFATHGPRFPDGYYVVDPTSHISTP
jgi:hypothetical protein